VFALKQAGTEGAVAGSVSQAAVSEATFYNWKKKYSELETAQLRRLRQLEEESARLK
jgi:putative transposase